MLSRHDGWCAQQPVVSERVCQPVLNAGGSVQAVHGRLSGCCVLLQCSCVSVDPVGGTLPCAAQLAG
jgi:hypothetical protein